MRNFLLRFTQSVNQPRTALDLGSPFRKFGHMFLDRIHRIYMIDQLHPVNLVKKRFLLLRRLTTIMFSASFFLIVIPAQAGIQKPYGSVRLSKYRFFLTGIIIKGVFNEFFQRKKGVYLN